MWKWQTTSSISRKQPQNSPLVLFWRQSHPKLRNPIVYTVRFLAPKKKERESYSSYLHWRPPQCKGHFLAMLGFTTETMPFSWHSCACKQSTPSVLSAGLLLAFELGSSLFYRNVSRAARCLLSQALAN